jgi:hypothetical protein
MWVGLGSEEYGTDQCPGFGSAKRQAPSAFLPVRACAQDVKKAREGPSRRVRPGARPNLAEGRRQYAAGSVDRDADAVRLAGSRIEFRTWKECAFRYVYIQKKTGDRNRGAGWRRPPSVCLSASGRAKQRSSCLTPTL